MATLSRLLENLKKLKIRKVRNKDQWQVIDEDLAVRWPCVGIFNSKKEAEEFKWRRAHG